MFIVKSMQWHEENGNIDREPKLVLVSKFDNGFVPGVEGTGVVLLGLVLEETEVSSNFPYSPTPLFQNEERVCERERFFPRIVMFMPRFVRYIYSISYRLNLRISFFCQLLGFAVVVLLMLSCTKMNIC